MEKQNRWMEELRDKLKNHSEPIPTRLWEQLEQELQEEVVESPPKTIPMWKQWQVVAAVAIMLVTSVFTFYFWGNGSEEFFQEQARVIEKEIVVDVKREESVINEVLTELVKSDFTKNKKSTTLLDKFNEIVETDKRIALVDVSETQVTQVEQTDVEAKEEPVQQRQEIEKQVKRKEFFTSAVSTVKKKNKQSTTFSLAMGNMPISSSQAYGGYKYLQADEKNSFLLKLSTKDDDAGLIPNYEPGTIEYALSSVMLDNIADDNVTTDVNHHAPITFGASLRFPLGNNWNLETGLIYTLLRSDLRSGSNSYYEEEYRLHYLGIPLKASRTIWSNRNFEVYASAGGVVEKSISGKRKRTAAGQTATESLDIKELQWSLSATVGAQYKVAPKMGFYVEPGMAYYFDDGSGIETIRKEHPFNFNLQLGFRVDF